MATIVNTALSGATVTYNGIQFGGSDSNYKSLPPMYQFVGTPVYDRSNRAVKFVEVSLSVVCVFYETSEASMAANMAAIQIALSSPGKLLTIAGLGSGFGIATAGVITADIDNGPKPGPVNCRCIGGQLAWELSWSISFRYVPCSNGNESWDVFTEFNFSTTWANDFEGLCTRTISGMIGIKHHRDPLASNTVHHVAEETRGNIVIEVPSGFKRSTNIWRENEAKDILEFTIIDEQLGGDALPNGITLARGSFDFVSGDGKGGFATALVVLSMTLKTAPNVHRNLAGKLFLAAVLSKQGTMATELGEGKQPIPLKLSISNQKFEDCRITQCSMVWMLTSPSLSTMLTAAGIWEPVSSMIGTTFGANQDYSTWKTSMTDLWRNKGLDEIGSRADEATIIDLCSNLNTKTIGQTTGPSQSLSSQSLPSLTCPTVSEEGGWITYDLEIVPLRKDNQSNHRKAAEFIPQSSAAMQDLDDPSTSANSPSGGPDYSQSSNDQDIIEYHGYPENYVGMKFRALRYVNTPFMPIIKTIQGNEVYQVHEEGGQPRYAFDCFGCPVWAVEGTRVYRVLGKVSSKKRVGSAVSLGASLDPTTAMEL